MKGVVLHEFELWRKRRNPRPLYVHRVENVWQHATLFVKEPDVCHSKQLKIWNAL